jgi:hypothetical protein
VSVIPHLDVSALVRSGFEEDALALEKILAVWWLGIRRLKGRLLAVVGHAPGAGVDGHGICSLAVTESTLWPSHKVSGPSVAAPREFATHTLPADYAPW